MTKHKALLFGLTAIAIFGTAAQSNCDSKKNKNAATNVSSNQINQNMTNNNKKPSETPPTNGGADVKTLAEGANSEIEQPFLFVARSAETYRQLQGAVKDLPSASGVNFDEQAIIAAFAGTRSSGGYSVEIKKSGEKVSISVAAPPPDAMTTQALTTPYKITAVPVEAEQSLNLEVAENWKNAARTFKLSSGEFESSGGIAGRLKKFAVQGTIEMWQFGDFATLTFNLSGKNADGKLRLTETASGIAKDGEITVSRLDAGSFSEGPKSPLKVSGMISNDKLSLNFEPLPAKVADGFQVRGKLEAISIK